jgi:hypothetical protein
LEDRIERLLVDGVKCLPKIQLQHNRRRPAHVATLNQVDSIEEVVGDVTPLNEAELLESNQALNKGLETRGQDAGDELHDAVLKGDGTKPVRRENIRFLGEQSDESSVHAIKPRDADMKVSKKLHYVTSDYVPEGAVESRTKAVRIGAAVDAHRPEDALHL